MFESVFEKISGVNEDSAVQRWANENEELSEDDKIIINWAVQKGLLPSSFPSYNGMMKELIKLPQTKKVSIRDIEPPASGENPFLDRSGVMSLYTQLVLLPQAEKLWAVQKKEGVVEGSETFKARLGQCYPLSGRYVINHPGSVLVHGHINGVRWTGKDFENPHAWVEEGDEVFDPVWDERFPKEVYYALMQAKDDKRYTYKEVWKITSKDGTWGPW